MCIDFDGNYSDGSFILYFCTRYVDTVIRLGHTNV